MPPREGILDQEIQKQSGYQIQQLLQANKVSAAAFKKWLKQYEEQGIEGLARADAAVGNVLPEGIDREEENYKREILKLRIENRNNFWCLQIKIEYFKKRFRVH